jgi:hypothetical protein
VAGISSPKIVIPAQAGIQKTGSVLIRDASHECRMAG